MWKDYLYDPTDMADMKRRRMSGTQLDDKRAFFFFVKLLGIEKQVHFFALVQDEALLGDEQQKRGHEWWKVTDDSCKMSDDQCTMLHYIKSIEGDHQGNELGKVFFSATKIKGPQTMANFEKQL